MRRRFAHDLRLLRERARGRRRGLVVTGAIAVALLATALLWLPQVRGAGTPAEAARPSPSAAPPGPPDAPAPADPAARAGLLAGPGCPDGATYNIDTWTPGNDGWHDDHGGWQGNGCSGATAYTRLTGAIDHWEDVFDWEYRVGESARCSFAVYVPDTPRAGANAAYDVYGERESTVEDRIATFTIDQPRHRGTWVDVPGTHTFPDGVAQLALVDRGKPAGATVAAAAAVLTCS
ncbi:hypothetical protein [Nonomuraea rubra]|uniref:Uncharacterized protein n=1 Tax=Nonomuraea rubra TaxID=46180 RepID=A0A7X0P1N3_9ACTN|nr:hypothetical protein [Nonomuraea rubra]MBB6553629.1 hypothetical protein [Nonomuraea rubra]